MPGISPLGLASPAAIASAFSWLNESNALPAESKMPLQPPSCVGR